MVKLKNPEDIAREYDAKARMVMEDHTLRREYQQQVLEELYNEARENIQQEIDREREELEVNARAARRLLYQPADLPGSKDRAQVYMLHNYHQDRLEKIDNVQELELYFNRVTMSDDVVGIKVCLTKAIDLMATDLTHRILSEYPEWEQVVENYTEATTELRDYSRAPHAFFGAGRLRIPREYLA